MEEGRLTPVDRTHHDHEEKAPHLEVRGLLVHCGSVSLTHRRGKSLRLAEHSTEIHLRR